MTEIREHHATRARQNLNPGILDTRCSAELSTPEAMDEHHANCARHGLEAFAWISVNDWTRPDGSLFTIVTTPVRLA